jgi:hypothetical protein
MKNPIIKNQLFSSAEQGEMSLNFDTPPEVRKINHCQDFWENVLQHSIEKLRLCQSIHSRAEGNYSTGR